VGPRVVRPSPAPPALPLSPGGKLRLLTIPADAEIMVDGRRVGVGSAFDLPIAVGVRRIQVRATGYTTFDTVLDVTAGGTFSLGRITLPIAEGHP
jgi:PEGA domain